MDQQNKNTTRVQPLPAYFCTKCNKYHYWGKIWRNHKNFKAEPTPFENKLKPIEWIYGVRIK